MTAGNVELAYRLEGGYREADEEGDWMQVSRGAEVTELDIDNQLEELRDPDNPIPTEQLEGNFEGALGISGTLTGDPEPPWLEDFVLHDDGSLPTSGGRAPSAEWAIGLDYIGGEIERLTQGTIVTEASLEWQNGQSWSFDLTLLYGFETKSESFDPTEIQTLGTEKVYNHAATDIAVDTMDIKGLSSLTVSLSNLARLRDGNGRFPYEAVVSGIEPTLDLQADITEESISNLELAYGDENEPADDVDTAAINIDATNKDGDALGIGVGAAKPNTVGWEQLTDPDDDEQENISFALFDDGDGAVSLS